MNTPTTVYEELVFKRIFEGSDPDGTVKEQRNLPFNLNLTTYIEEKVWLDWEWRMKMCGNMYSCFF